MASDAVFKVGRGGAGNYYTQQDGPVQAAGAAIADHQQPQVQIQSSSHTAQARTTGRGGAGNMVGSGPDAPAPAASSPGQDEESRGEGDSEAATQAVLIRESHATRLGRLGGRGGAGNWLENSSAKDRNAWSNEEKTELERRVRQEVDEGLRAPEPAHNRVRRWDKV